MLLKSIFLFLILSVQSVHAQDFGNGFYRLTTQWLGETKSLDVVNDGKNNQLQMADSGNYSGQFWKLTPVGNGFYRLTTQWLGEEKSLDVVNDGTNNKLQMAKSGDFSGQFWKITPVKNGFYRLTTKWLGETKSLDVVNDGTNNKLQLAKSGDFSGQLWKISPVSASPDTGNYDLEIKTPLDVKRISLQGFKIIINSKIAEKADTKTALELLSKDLEKIATIVKPKQLNLIKQVPIWIEIKHLTGKAMWYHKHKEWVISNGYPAEAAKSVEINNVRNYIDWQAQNQPFMILHELAHAYHDLYLSAEMKEKITNAYNNAVISKKYDNVPYSLGGNRRAYALDTEDEYFAELTEAYLGENDYYPYNRQQLKDFDPTAYKIMQAAWD